MSTFLIIVGSSGVGSAIVNDLLSNGHKVFASYFCTPIKFEHPQLTSFKLDVLSEWCEEIIPDEAIDGFVYCPGAINLKPFHRSTLDYFNSCAENSNFVDVPSNFMGFEYAATGQGYIGLVTYSANSANHREFIEAELLEPMTPEVNYLISLKISCSDLANFSTNSFGAYLSTGYANSSELTASISLIPQLQINSALSDTSGWTTFSTQYFAQGGEKFIVLGNFNNDSETTVNSINNNVQSAFQVAYVYVDDVTIEYSLGIDPKITKTNRKPIKVIDIMGREIEPKSNVLYINVYIDGSTEKIYRTK